MPYSLGPVKAHVQAAADRIGGIFKPSSILGWGLRARESDHPKGLALDFMVGSNKAKGDAIAGHVKANAAAYGIKYVIWQQRIWNSDGSEHAMEDRGSATENHMDHVHVSFNAEPGSGNYTDGGESGGLSCAVTLLAGSAAIGVFAELVSRVVGR